MTKKKIATGKRVVFAQKGVVEIRDWDVFEPERGEVLFENRVSLVSPGTELSRLHDTHSVSRPYPTNTGYVSAGRVVKLGPGVEGVEPGQPVLSSLGHISHHPVPASSLTPVPEGMELKDAVWTALCRISIFGVQRGGVGLGDAVGVFGLGVIGQLAVAFSHLAGGLPVVGIDPVAFRRQKALEVGADATIDPRDGKLAEQVRDLTAGHGFDVVIESTGTPHVAHQLFEYCAPGAVVVILGGVHKPVSLDLYSHFQRKGITMVGAHGPTTPQEASVIYRRNTGFNTAYILRAIRKGALKVGTLLTHLVPFRQAPEMYRALTEEKDRTLGVAFDWTETAEELQSLWG